MTRPSLSERLARARADRIPPGWLTAAQLCVAEGQGRNGGGFHYVIQRAVRTGLLESKTFRVYYPAVGAVRRVAHYRYTSPKKSR